MRVLITGATGKVGQHLLRRILADPALNAAGIRALCHNRTVTESSRVDVVRGSISDRDVVARAMDGVTHVVHLATCKETPDDAMDVGVKGMFWVLEEARTSPAFEQFILLGGDCSVGHIFVEHAAPITEQTPRLSYPGCYALSKVLEEVMLEQYYVQYDLNGCCLRAPWIMEKDDFKYTLSFGDDLFGGPVWKDMVPAGDAETYRRTNTVPLLKDSENRPLKRNFVHVEDLVSAILKALDNPKARQQTFNICMDRPIDYGEMAAYLKQTRNLPHVEIESGYFSNWLDNSKAKLLLGWSPDYDMERIIESAWAYQRPPDEPRKIWYPG